METLLWFPKFGTSKKAAIITMAKERRKIRNYVNKEGLDSEATNSIQGYCILVTLPLIFIEFKMNAGEHSCCCGSCYHPIVSVAIIQLRDDGK